MSRTTLDLDESVLHKLRRYGSEQHKSMGQLASELLARALSEAESATAAKSVKWVSRDLGVPRVDLEDKEAVRALLDEHS